MGTVFQHFAFAKAVVVQLYCAAESPGGAVKADCWACHTIADLVVWGEGLRICIFNKFPRAADAPGPKTTL